MDMNSCEFKENLGRVDLLDLKKMKKVQSVYEGTMVTKQANTCK